MNLPRADTPPPLSAEERAATRERRLLPRSSEEIAEEIDRTGLGYRQGCPTLPPLPVDTVFENAHQKLGEFSVDLFRSIRDIYDQKEIKVNRVFLATRAPRITLPNTSYHTIVVCFIGDEKRQMDDAIIQIRRKLLERESTSDLLLELIESRALLGLKSFALLPSDTLVVKNHTQVYKKVLSAIHEFKEEW